MVVVGCGHPSAGTHGLSGHPLPKSLKLQWQVFRVQWLAASAPITVKAKSKMVWGGASLEWSAHVALISGRVMWQVNVSHDMWLCHVTSCTCEIWFIALCTFHIAACWIFTLSQCLFSVLFCFLIRMFPLNCYDQTIASIILKSPGNRWIKISFKVQLLPRSIGFHWQMSTPRHCISSVFISGRFHWWITGRLNPPKSGSGPWLDCLQSQEWGAFCPPRGCLML